MALLETSLLGFAAERLSKLLPSTWTVGVKEDAPGADGYLTVRSPTDEEATFVVELKARASAGAAAMVEQLLFWASRHPGNFPLLVMPYIGPAVRRVCQDNGISFIDRTGWAWITIERPALVIRTEGAVRDPQPARDTAMSRLSGTGAGRVLRALLARTEPVGVRALAHEVGVSPGTVSKVLKALAPEGVVRRDDAGRVAVAAKRELVKRWTHDYQFLRTNEVRRYLAPRGLGRVMSSVAETDLPIVGTGSLALRHYLPPDRIPVTGLAQIALLVADPERVAAALKLVKAEPTTTTVFLAAPYDTTLLEIPRSDSDRIAIVDAGQAVADLLTLPGRGPEEAEQLIELLAETDLAWG